MSHPVGTSMGPAIQCDACEMRQGRFLTPFCAWAQMCEDKRTAIVRELDALPQRTRKLMEGAVGRN